MYDKIADLGCILCLCKGHQGTPAEIHHIRRFGGKRDNAPVIGLCPEHHRGNTGVHGLGHKGFEKHHGISEEDLLDLTNFILNTDTILLRDSRPHLINRFCISIQGGRWSVAVDASPVQN